MQLCHLARCRSLLHGAIKNFLFISILLFNDFLLLLFNVSYKCTNIVTFRYLCLTVNLDFGSPPEIGTNQYKILKEKKRKKKQRPTVRPSRFFKQYIFCPNYEQNGGLHKLQKITHVGPNLMDFTHLQTPERLRKFDRNNIAVWR